MSRKSKRELERAIEELLPDDGDGPDEIVIRSEVIATDADVDAEPTGGLVTEARLRRDTAGTWHSEPLDETDTEGEDAATE